MSTNYRQLELTIGLFYAIICFQWWLPYLLVHTSQLTYFYPGVSSDLVGLIYNK